MSNVFISLYCSSRGRFWIMKHAWYKFSQGLRGEFWVLPPHQSPLAIAARGLVEDFHPSLLHSHAIFSYNFLLGSCENVYHAFIMMFCGDPCWVCKHHCTHLLLAFELYYRCSFLVVVWPRHVSEGHTDDMRVFFSERETNPTSSWTLRIATAPIDW